MMDLREGPTARVLLPAFVVTLSATLSATFSLAPPAIITAIIVAILPIRPFASPLMLPSRRRLVIPLLPVSGRHVVVPHWHEQEGPRHELGPLQRRDRTDRAGERVEAPGHKPLREVSGAISGAVVVGCAGLHPGPSRLDSRFGECLDCPRIVDPASGPSSEATCPWIRRQDYCSLALVGHLVAPAGAFVFQASTCHRGWAMSIVAISETAGSMGIEIGRKLAESLGWEFADREILSKASEQFGENVTDLRHSVEEKPTLWERFSDTQHRYKAYVE